VVTYVYNFKLKKHEEKDRLGDEGVDVSMILKRTVKQFLSNGVPRNAAISRSNNKNSAR
jgi:hypothetical protein